MASGNRGYVFQRGASFSVRITINGKRRTKGGFETETMARDWAANEYRKAQKAEVLGIEPIRDDGTLGSILRPWLGATKPKVAASTLESYRSIAEKILIPYFREKKLAEIRKRDVQAFLADRASAGKSNATLNRYQTTLSRIFEYAVANGYARTNVAREVKRARETPISYPYLSPEDEGRLLAALPDWLRTPCLVALDAGLRAGEICDLRPRDVDLRRAVLVVRRSKSNKPREVGMTDRLRDALRRHMRALPKGTEWAFLHPEGGRFEKSRYRHFFQHATKAADLEGFRFHDLRHSCGVRLAEAGATPAMIKAVLGHKSLAATMRYMDHAPLDAARTAARLLDTRRQSAGEETEGGAAAP